MRRFLAVVLLSLSFQSHATAAAPAKRIVTLAPNLTELVFAVGAGERIVGTVMYSDYPDAARRIPRVGDAFRVDSERVLALRPDLVLAWASGTPQAVIDNLKALGLRVVTLEVSHLAQVSGALRELGALMDLKNAAGIANEFERDIAALRTQYAGRKRLRVFIEVDRQPLFTVNGQHVISEVVALCGGDNVFADLPQLAPSVGVEAVLEKNPQVILGSVIDAASLRADWAQWPNLSAVRLAQVYAVNPDIVNRATPRLAQGASEVCKVLDRARAKQTAN